MACKDQLFGIEDVGEKEEQRPAVECCPGAGAGVGGVHPHCQAGSGEAGTGQDGLHQEQFPGASWQGGSSGSEWEARGGASTAFGSFQSLLGEEGWGQGRDLSFERNNLLCVLFNEFSPPIRF